MSLMVLFKRQKQKGRNKCKMYKLKNYKHRKERTSKNQLKYLIRFHLKNIYFPTELDQQIVVDEDATSPCKSKKHSSKKNIDEGSFIPDQQFVHLNALASIHKRKRQDVESNLSTENQSEISRYSLEIITPCGDLDDGVVNKTQNVI